MGKKRRRSLGPAAKREAVAVRGIEVAAAASVLLEASQAKADEFVDFCGLGGAIDTATPGACATSRWYPGQHGTKDRRTTFDSEPHVLRGDYAKIPGLRGQRACWELFREELGRLAAVDERPFAISRLNDENWLATCMRAEKDPVQSAHIYWGMVRGARFLRHILTAYIYMLKFNCDVVVSRQHLRFVRHKFWCQVIVYNKRCDANCANVNGCKV